MPTFYQLNYDSISLLVLMANCYVSCASRGENNLASQYLLLIPDEYKTTPTTRRVEICMNLIVAKGVDGKFATEPEIYASIIYFIYTAILTDRLDDLKELMNRISEIQFDKEREGSISSMEFMLSQENIKSTYEIIENLKILPFDNLHSCRYFKNENGEQLLELKFNN